MKHCKTCKWFPAGATESRCGLFATVGSLKHPENRDGPSARCLSGNAWFWVPATFGCVKHEPRPKPGDA